MKKITGMEWIGLTKFWGERHLRFGLIILLTHLGFGQMNGQSLQENLESGIRNYKEVNSYRKEMALGVDDEKFTWMAGKVDDGYNQLNRVLENGDTPQKLTAAYFITKIVLERCFILGKMGYTQDAYRESKNNEVNVYSLYSTIFPFEYSYAGYTETATWDDYSLVLIEYYQMMGEVCFVLQKYDEAVEYFGLLTSADAATPELKWHGHDLLLAIHDLQPDLITGESYSRNLLMYLKTYFQLGSDQQDRLRALPGAKSISHIIRLLVEEGSRPEATDRTIIHSAEAVHLAAAHEKYDMDILRLYELCFQKFESDPMLSLDYKLAPDKEMRDFSKNAELYARSMRDQDGDKAANVGISATAQLARFTANDCDLLDEVAGNYQYWNRPEEAARYTKLGAPCRESRAKEDKVSIRREKREASNFNLYAGIYPLALLKSADRRDIGGVINFAFKKVALEFSYIQVKRNKENIFDLWIREIDDASQDNISRWDGYYAHFQPKFMHKEGTGSYSYGGLLLGYGEKTFDQMAVAITNDLTLAESIADFAPEIRQYVVMGTFGLMVLKKGFGADVFWSIGANYNQFDAGTDINREEYTIANPLLENRKDKFWGVTMRLGLTMGINLGNGK